MEGLWIRGDSTGQTIGLIELSDLDGTTFIWNVDTVSVSD